MNNRKHSPSGNGHALPDAGALPHGAWPVEPMHGGGDPPIGADDPPEPAPEHLPIAAGEGEVGNTLQTYLREIRRAPLFTPDEEFAMATRARAGDFAARQQMIERNLRLVVSIAKSYLSR
ncbi:MAG: sigma-70 factor domain-containing protein, partial [Methylibium sp.]|nr:sigma-70 factor domain-containing protein [Methylibium sp.]